MMTTHSMPIPTAAVIDSSSSGEAFITDWTDLFNARPADATRIQWCSGTQTTSSYVDLQFTIVSTVVRVVGLVGLNIFELTDCSGFKIVITGQRSGDTGYPYDLGGTSQTTRVYKRSDGSYALICVCAAGLTPIIGYQVRIYNDQNGTHPIVASQFVDLGKIWASPGFDLDIEQGWRLTPGVNKLPQSLNYQPWPVQYPPGRTLSFQRTEMDFNTAFIDGADPSWQSLRALIGSGKPSIMIPRWGNAAAPDKDKIHATAIFGMASFTALQHIAGPYYSVEGSSIEAPALLAE
jgi:hypothetical protein